MVINEEILNNLTNNGDANAVQENFKIISDMIQEALTNVNVSFPTISLDNTYVYPVGPFVLGTYTESFRQFDVVVEIFNPTIFENDKLYIKTKIKKRKQDIDSTIKVRDALVKVMAQYFSPLTKFFDCGKFIRIDSSLEYGYYFNIFVLGSKDTEIGNSCYGIDTNNNKRFRFSPINYEKNFELKNDLTNDLFRKMSTILQNVASFSNTNKSTQHYRQNMEFLIDNLLFNVPNELFSGSLSDCLIKVFNYINNVDLTKLKLIDNTDGKLISSDNVMNYSYLDIKNIISMLFNGLLQE
jgi:hypothetical protein